MCLCNSDPVKEDPRSAYRREWETGMACAPCCHPLGAFLLWVFVSGLIRRTEFFFLTALFLTQFSPFVFGFPVLILTDLTVFQLQFSFPINFSCFRLKNASRCLKYCSRGKCVWPRSRSPACRAISATRLSKVRLAPSFDFAVSIFLFYFWFLRGLYSFVNCERMKLVLCGNCSHDSQATTPG